ncbi:hypothetical protein BVC80_1833g128 [Macleaya cordata]|uniref:Uncharacterized protein n=1 Tax=Macleaya cordata TaxID=56857 RepID=A0A200R6Y2_MACCD|nr:hypothetical protein BVC80_1833g128 [Macleaya cordata]
MVGLHQGDYVFVRSKQENWMNLFQLGHKLKAVGQEGPNRGNLCTTLCRSALKIVAVACSQVVECSRCGADTDDNDDD